MFKLPNSLLFLPILLSVCFVAADEPEDREALRKEIEYLTLGDQLSTEVDLAAGDLLAEIYARRNFSPAWNDYDQIAELILAIEATEADGLNPSDYHLENVKLAYRALQSGRVTSSQDRALTDLMLTDSLIRLGYHQFFGKVNPYTLDPNWNFRRELNNLDPATAVQEAIDSPSLTEYVNSLFPRGWAYRELQAALAAYRGIQAKGGWPQISEGPTLRPGAADDRLSMLARRLAISGDIEDVRTFAPITTYDDLLEEGVRQFQHRHGLDVDGVIGPATLTALNVPVEQRIGQLEISLERARWVMDDVEDEFVLVNIAGFQAYVIRDREIVWQTRVQVGTAYRQSPVFRDEIKYLVFNPTWTVPYSIATRDILPQVQREPGYFASRNFDVKNRDGEIIDPSTVDWPQVTRRSFRYTLIQRPGPDNALGRVKFIFPNEHAVYLHDTPSRPLFGRAERAFSSGCIRVENPFDLAELLLGSDGWTQERFREVLDSGEITTVFLPEPMPVMLLYWTAMVGQDGIVYFYNDVYNRDQAVADVLDAPFRLEPPGS